MKVKPYIGITGVTSLDEVNGILSYFEKANIKLDSSHLPMLGFLVSYKTLNGEIVENKRYPRIETLRNLLKETKNKAFNTIHYNTKDLDNLSDQINSIFYNLYQDDLCKGLQLNIPWPDFNEVNKIKKNFSEMKIILQISYNIIEKMDRYEISDRVKSYNNLIDYVLIDPSGGRGKEIDTANGAILIYDEIKNKSPNLCIGFAGGLHGGNVASKILQLKQRTRTHNFSIDAEGALRDKLSDKYGDDILNLKKIESYLLHAYDAFNS